MGKKKKKFKKHNKDKRNYYVLEYSSQPHQINTVAFKVFGSLYYNPSDN